MTTLFTEKPQVLPYNYSLSTQLELFFSCRNLPKKDISSPSDPFVVIFYKDEKKNKFERVNHTEVFKDNQNPDFSKELIVNYMFEEVQIFRLEVWDCDAPDLYDLSKHDFLGWAEFVLGDLVTARGQTLIMKLKNKQGKELKIKDIPVSITVRCEEVKTDASEFMAVLGARHLPKKNLFRSVSSFIQIYRKAEDGGWMSIYTSETAHRASSPKWKPIRVTVRRLCNGDYKRPILFKCFDGADRKEPRYLGECETSLTEILEGSSTLVFKKRNNKTGVYKKGKTYGELLIKEKKLNKKSAFIEYIMGGMEINLVVAIDFTASNGDPKDPRSLHYLGPPNYESQYLKAIRSVGRVLEPYDSDRMIGVYGFGARFPNTKEVSHCFPLALNHGNAQVYGIEGVVEAYMSALKNVELYGPTLFASTINTVHDLARIKDKNPEKQRYTILLMITDGEITDMQSTVDSIIEATESPMSIIIVGVGDSNFSRMEELDADDKPLINSHGQRAKRDIVQFVQFNQFVNAHISLLAKETLEELPRQVEQCMEMLQWTPHQRRQKDSVSDRMYEGPSALANNEPFSLPRMQQAPVANPSSSSVKTTAAMYPEIGINPYYGASAPPSQ